MHQLYNGFHMILSYTHIIHFIIFTPTNLSFPSYSNDLLPLPRSSLFSSLVAVVDADVADFDVAVVADDPKSFHYGCMDG